MILKIVLIVICSMIILTGAIYFSILAFRAIEKKRKYINGPEKLMKVLVDEINNKNIIILTNLYDTPAEMTKDSPVHQFRKLCIKITKKEPAIFTTKREYIISTIRGVVENVDWYFKWNFKGKKGENDYICLYIPLEYKQAMFSFFNKLEEKRKAAEENKDVQDKE